MKRKIDSVRLAVARVIGRTKPCDGVKSHFIHRAEPMHPYSGGQRLRELRSECEAYYGLPSGWACMYDTKTKIFYPVEIFVNFCRSLVREAKNNS